MNDVSVNKERFGLEAMKIRICVYSSISVTPLKVFKWPELLELGTQILG